MKCSKCSFENKAESKFCIKCGSALLKKEDLQNDESSIDNLDLTKVKKNKDLLSIFGLILLLLSLLDSSFITMRIYNKLFGLNHILWASLPFAMSFYVKKKSVKLVLMILGIVNIILVIRHISIYLF